ncbi:hypothetical protein EXN66_Car000694 [Channa argus]|uniref:Uncharacterized protein n=1 Tax=Channa argus TaxID=215402 RepID=A0A6G1QXU6_CHAAH|nr:hypothetical protein EXN66_Car000694 [Channa argus]
MTLSNSHNSQQRPIVHLLALPWHIHICSQTNTEIHKCRYMHKHTDTNSRAAVDQPWSDV